MFWIICAIISVILILLGIQSYLKKENGALRVVFVLLFLFLATYVIYIPAFLNSYGVVSGLIGNLIHVLQVITLDADFTQFYDDIRAGINSRFLASVYMVIQGVLHTSLPFVSALTALTVLFRCFSSMQLLFANNCNRPMFIFSEANERAFQLAESLKKLKCDIVFANSDDDSFNNEDDSKRGFIFKEEDITDIKVKSKNKDIYFFCITEDEDVSLSCSLQLIEKYSNLKESEQSRIHIYQFSRFEDYSVFVDSADKGALDIRCVNEYESLVYNLLDKHPLYKYAKSDIHVLLHGMSPINIIALKAVVWCGQISGLSMKISVVGIDIKEKVEELKVDVPGLFSGRYDIRFFDCCSENEIVSAVSEQCADANYILVSENSDNETMSRGLLLRRLFYRLDKNFENCPPIFCYIKDNSKFNVVKNLSTAEMNPSRKMSYHLTPYGSLEEVYTYENLVDSDIEKLSRNVHLAYEEIFSDGEIDVDEALKRYHVFEVNQRSNRAAALHIRYKLFLLGLDYTDKNVGEAVSMQACNAEERFDLLARSEHDRWMAFLDSEGWIPAEKEDVYAYRNSGISKGRHNCPLLKMHPYMCEYEKLEQLSIDLEGKDTTVYDRELIMRIPDILGDKWGAAGKTFQIINLDNKLGGERNG